MVPPFWLVKELPEELPSITKPPVLLPVMVAAFVVGSAKCTVPVGTFTTPPIKLLKAFPLKSLLKEKVVVPPFLLKMPWLLVT